MNEKLKGRLLKLLALTKSSNEHEAANAQSRIEALCKKHGVNINDLLDESEAIETHWFRYDDQYSKTVLIQTIYRATNISKMFRSRYKQRQTGVECTKSQAAEIELWWGVMRAAFKQHIEDCTNAFVMANNLYGEPSEEESDNDDMDWEALERVMRLAQNVSPTPVMRGIENKS